MFHQLTQCTQLTHLIRPPRLTRLTCLIRFTALKTHLPCLPNLPGSHQLPDLHTHLSQLTQLILHTWLAWLILTNLLDLPTKTYFKDPPHIPILPDVPKLTGLTKLYCLALPNNHDTQVTPYLTYSTKAGLNHFANHFPDFPNYQARLSYPHVLFTILSFQKNKSITRHARRTLFWLCNRLRLSETQFLQGSEPKLYKDNG